MSPGAVHGGGGDSGGDRRQAAVVQLPRRAVRAAVRPAGQLAQRAVQPRSAAARAQRVTARPVRGAARGRGVGRRGGRGRRRRRLHGAGHLHQRHRSQLPQHVRQRERAQLAESRPRHRLSDGRPRAMSPATADVAGRRRRPRSMSPAAADVASRRHRLTLANTHRRIERIASLITSRDVSVNGDPRTCRFLSVQ